MGSGRPPFTRAIASRRAMLNTMRLPHGMELASLGARIRVPLHGYVLSLLALVASLLLVWLYWNNAQQSELKRSDERRVGKECFSTCIYRGSPAHSKKKHRCERK